ncbi:penicillin-binding transpeptidase domain-containing protein [Planococcus shenhongbingii]|uniref:Penicillin-binding transpeptidase domain-containing protein n=1 Tax=Planococcus shenhongbingii TaxID=3058398 RepID=A0ABT8N8P3_9BACL|nr:MULTISPECIES: penicillin-binding transpeptidase domain-containing protein [unclassified Planococcus (in: firmicutes)]MDN7244273.1 penicillin-binding transpeptidase domain-containing protein [Planococcus sp. N017]WKA57442.1 penicillin-binding transpeptidase domain-containing protein [Planococcus sp. N016]
MKKKFRFQWGAFLLFLVFAGLFFILTVRIVTIQATGTVEGQELAAKAAAKYQQEQVLTAERGKILDRNGDVIAEDTLTYKVVAVLDESATQHASSPRHVTNVEKTAEALAQHIKMPEEKILDILKQGVEKDRYQVEFGAAGREISHTQMLEMKEDEIPGIIFVKDLKRLYPNGIFASHLVGFAMKEETDDGQMVTKGRMGLESIHDKALTGKNGKMEFSTDKWGFLLPNSESAVTPAVDGSNVQLTLDRTLQNFLEDAMTKVQDEYEPARMIAVIADPDTGEILAMSQRPTFNPNTREGLSDNWLNESIELTIEPGSPMKMFTLASAIEEGKWDPDAYYNSGKYTLLDTTIGDYNSGRGWGSITFLEGFQRSSNVSMAYLLERVGPETFMTYIDAFGFGKKTGIDLPNEASGKILNEYPINRLTTSYGQGSTVTPIQMIQAASAIANEGVMMKPYVIDQIKNPDSGKVSVKSKPEEAGQPISAETAKEVRKILASTVTSEVGSGRPFALQDYTVAGKTGTAQVPGKDGRYINQGKNGYLYSFLGMAPAEDPELLVYIGVQQPQLPAGEYGSAPVAKIFTSVMENGLKHMNIKPKNSKSAKTITLEDYAGKSSANTTKELTKKGLKVAVTGGASEVKGQFPEAGQTIVEGGTVILKTEGPTILPDFTGWSKRDLLAYQSLSGLSLELAGQGYAVSQSLSKGSKVTQSDPVVIQLQTPEDFSKVQMTDGPEGIPPEDQVISEEEAAADPGIEETIEEENNAGESVEEELVEETPEEEIAE